MFVPVPGFLFCHAVKKGCVFAAAERNQIFIWISLLPAS
jgi:hypothetical protein